MLSVPRRTLVEAVSVAPEWRWIAALDLVFILATGASPHLASEPLLGPVLSAFDLGTETNLATWWSSLTLAAIGVLAYQASSFHARSRHRAWAGLGLLFLALSWDEIGSFHERIADRTEIVFVFVGAAILAALLAPLLADPKTRRPALLLLLGFALFALAALQEVLEFAWSWPAPLRGLRAAAEEGSELAGTLVCYLGVAYELSRHGTRLAPIPDPERLRGPAAILSVGFLLHACVSLVGPASLEDLSQLGNPEAWYPSLIFFVLFLVHVRERSALSRAAAAWFLASCLLVPYVFRLQALRDVAIPFGILTLLCGVGLALMLRRLTRRKTLLLVALGALVALLFPLHTPRFKHIAFGALCLGFALLFWPPSRAQRWQLGQ